MRLVALPDGQHRILSEAVDCDGKPIPSVIQDLSELDSQYQGSATGMYTVLERYAAQGRDGVTSGQFHEASKQDGVWEFVKGRIRIYCFIDDGNLVILSHAIIKKTQKAQKADVNKAVRMRNKYLGAKNNNTLEILAGEE